MNLALNLVGGSRLAWQQRKAASFTVSALHCGSRDLGYRTSSQYGGGITLGTAVAISGAAASPNMGYHSSPVVGFIMTLFNARLGSWLGNPGPPGARTWRDPGPLSAVRSMVREALGQTSDQSSTSTCQTVGTSRTSGSTRWCGGAAASSSSSTAAAIPTSPTTTWATPFARSGSTSESRSISTTSSACARSVSRKQRCAVARIRYSVVDGAGTDGRLVYVKPMLLGNEGPDVSSYAASHRAFPHEGTGDQWFNESQTESYRALGLHTVDEICRGWSGGRIADLCGHLERRIFLPGLRKRLNVASFPLPSCKQRDPVHGGRTRRPSR